MFHIAVMKHFQSTNRLDRTGLYYLTRPDRTIFFYFDEPRVPDYSVIWQSHFFLYFFTNCVSVFLEGLRVIRQKSNSSKFI